MSRENQPCGLSSGAKNFLRAWAGTRTVQTRMETKECATNLVEFQEWSAPFDLLRHKSEVYDYYFGYWDEKFPLLRYTRPDGLQVEEYLQETICSGGPVMFLALRDTNTSKPIDETKWVKADMDLFT